MYGALLADALTAYQDSATDEGRASASADIEEYVRAIAHDPATLSRATTNASARNSALGSN